MLQKEKIVNKHTDGDENKSFISIYYHFKVKNVSL